MTNCIAKSVIKKNKLHKKYLHHPTANNENKYEHHAIKRAKRNTIVRENRSTDTPCMYITNIIGSLHTVPFLDAIIWGGGGIFIHSCSHTVKTIAFKRNPSGRSGSESAKPRNKSGHTGHYDRWITKFTGHSGIYSGHCHSLASPPPPSSSFA